MFNNENQTEVKSNLAKFMLHSEDSFLFLQEVPGSGKTIVVNEFMKEKYFESKINFVYCHTSITCTDQSVFQTLASSFGI